MSTPPPLPPPRVHPLEGGLLRARPLYTEHITDGEEQEEEQLLRETEKHYK